MQLPDITVGGKVAFDYIKSQYFRVIHADGAIGSITPNGLIHFALYSERPAIPRRLVQPVSEDGQLGDPIESETESRDSIIREMDVDVMMTLEVAVLVRNWLSERIDQHQLKVASNPKEKSTKK